MTEGDIFFLDYLLPKMIFEQRSRHVCTVVSTIVGIGHEGRDLYEIWY